jgi:hypothetical protein
MHSLSVDKTVIQRQTICDKYYNSDDSKEVDKEYDYISYIMDDDLIGGRWLSSDDNEVFWCV